LGICPPILLQYPKQVFFYQTGAKVKITNPDYASSGSDFESIEDIRKRAPLSLRNTSTGCNIL
jgi:hypothetical protein